MEKNDSSRIGKLKEKSCQFLIKVKVWFFVFAILGLAIGVARVYQLYSDVSMYRCSPKDKTVSILQNGKLVYVDVESIIPQLYQAYFENPNEANTYILEMALSQMTCVNLLRARNLWVIANIVIIIILTIVYFTCFSRRK